MSEISNPQIIFSRRKKHDYGLILMSFIAFLLLSLLDMNTFRYIWVIGAIGCLIFIVVIYIRPAQQIFIFDQSISIKYGRYTFSTNWKNIIAVDFMRTGGGDDVSSGQFRIITKDTRSIPLDFWGWYILEKSDSQELSELINKLKPIQPRRVLLSFSKINDEDERLQLILDIIEKKSGIKATFQKVL